MRKTPKRPAQILADYIRKRSAAAALTSRKSLMEEADDMEELIAAMARTRTARIFVMSMGRRTCIIIRKRTWQTITP